MSRSVLSEISVTHRNRVIRRSNGRPEGMQDAPNLEDRARSICAMPHITSAVHNYAYAVTGQVLGPVRLPTTSPTLQESHRASRRRILGRARGKKSFHTNIH